MDTEFEDAGVEKQGLGAPQDTGVEEDGSGAPQNQEDNTDWKALYEEQVTETENYKTALTQKRQIVKKPVEISEDEEDDDEKPFSRSQMREEIKNIFVKEVVPLVTPSKEEALLKQKISDPAKRDLVKHILNNRIVRTGTSDAELARDIEEAIGIADRKKLAKKSAEVTRVLENQHVTPPTAGSGSDNKGIKKDFKLDPTLEKSLEDRARALNLDPQKFKENFVKNRPRTTIAG